MYNFRLKFCGKTNKLIKSFLLSKKLIVSQTNFKFLVVKLFVLIPLVFFVFSKIWFKMNAEQGL